jgi:hypothetical protein
MKIGTGFETLRRNCDRLSISATFGSPQTEVPSTILGQPLEQTLRALYHEHRSVCWSSPEFSLTIYPLEGPDALEWRNVSLRHSGADYMPPYPFDDLLAFAQYGHQASYLATVPALASKDGEQPVLYVDTHEDPWAVPIGYSVDATFALLSHYIDHRATKQLGRVGLVEINFPLDIPDLISTDAVLSELVVSKEFEAWTRGDESIHEWICRTFGCS